jgi:hypothetical protein
MAEVPTAPRAVAEARPAAPAQNAMAEKFTPARAAGGEQRPITQNAMADAIARGTADAQTERTQIKTAIGNSLISLGERIKPGSNQPESKAGQPETNQPKTAEQNAQTGLNTPAAPEGMQQVLNLQGAARVEDLQHQAQQPEQPAGAGATADQDKGLAQASEARQAALDTAIRPAENVTRAEAVKTLESMTASEIRRAIGKGEITDTKALPMMLQKEIDETRAVYAKMNELHPDEKEVNDKNLAALEAENRKLMTGSPEDLAAFCKAESERSKNQQLPLTDGRGNYSEENTRLMAEGREAAYNWSKMSEAYAQEVKHLPTDQQQTLDYLRDHPTSLTAISTIQNLSSEELQRLISTLQQTQEKATPEQTDQQPGVEQGQGVIQFLLDLLVSLLPDKKVLDEVAKEQVRAELARVQTAQ